MSGHFDRYSWWVFCRGTACASCRRLESRCCGNRCPRRYTWIHGWRDHVSECVSMCQRSPWQHDMNSMNRHEQYGYILNNHEQSTKTPGFKDAWRSHWMWRCHQESKMGTSLIKMGPEEKTTSWMWLEQAKHLLIASFWSQSQPRWSDGSDRNCVRHWQAYLCFTMKRKQRTRPYQPMDNWSISDESPTSTCQNSSNWITFLLPGGLMSSK